MSVKKIIVQPGMDQDFKITSVKDRRETVKERKKRKAILVAVKRRRITMSENVIMSVKYNRNIIHTNSFTI